MFLDQAKFLILRDWRRATAKQRQSDRASFIAEAPPPVQVQQRRRRVSVIEGWLVEDDRATKRSRG